LSVQFYVHNAELFSYQMLISYLVSDPLAAYVKERITEADGLMRRDASKILERSFIGSSSWPSRSGTYTRWLLPSENCPSLLGER
jgi:hypothetical protein